ncbi:D-alanyl-D-alanine carboxypeptidase/D-alanyl-D-alanine endopeptidase [Cytobacillus spongiae]|uniref:D-alanyl-D-alanine carboxypeptidase/D-alanyl-D-alanine endopeptidase n=1 Tax=Cytobacillus spongiae TaxID=2901381 RepID=UPI003D7A6E04
MIISTKRKRGANKIRIRWIFLICLLLGSTFIHPTASARTSSFAAQVNTLIQKDSNLAGALVGISIRSADSGKILYDRFGDMRLEPASSLKLFTAAAAFSSLGEEYTFSTELLSDGHTKGKQLTGNLYLKGKGDPTLLPTDFELLAKKLAETGVKEIHGSLIGDDTWYDDIRHSIDMPWSDEQMYYGAAVSALTASPDQDYDAGTVIVEVSSGAEIGAAPNVLVFPRTSHLTIRNEATTISPESLKDLQIERDHGVNTVRISGTIPLNAKPEKEWIAVWDPSSYALNLFEQALANQGIVLTGKSKLGSAPDDGTLLEKRHSIPLKELVIPFLKLSNNGHGEILVKEMGKVDKGEGSWEKGLEVMKEKLQQLGVNVETTILRDGSGISHVNAIPPNELTKLLYVVQNQPWFSSYFAALPVAGVTDKRIGGTLRYRLTEKEIAGTIHAKTGTLSTVSTISGYLQSKNGEKLIFCIMMNQLLDEDKGKDFEDQLLRLLVNNEGLL